VQPEPPGLVRDEERCRFVVIQRCGRGERARRVHDGVLGERPVRQRRPADHPVANAKPRYVSADLDDLAAQLDARGERQRRADLVAATAQQHVGEVRRRREHAHQELARAGLGKRYLG
jgi:hypothetical protein